MYVVAYFEVKDYIHLNMLRAVDDEDVAHEFAYQHALDEFGDADNVELYGPDADVFAKFDIPNLVDAFTSKQQHDIGFMVLAVQYVSQGNSVF